MCADIVIVGGGPVGLWTAIQIKKRQPEATVQMYERYEEYQRSHVLRLEHLSMLLYGKNSRDPLEKTFYKEVTGKNLTQVFQVMTAPQSVFIRTNDLEAALKNYAKALGVKMTHDRIETPDDAMRLHPECKTFIAADGAHSQMRKSLLGEDATRDYPLQYVAEVKYQADGKAGHLGTLQESYKTNKIMSHMAFEYVGREKQGVTPVTLRFFVDKQTYADLPQASFKKPLLLDDPRVPENLAQDISTYMGARAAKAQENYTQGSGKITKLTLSLYAAKKFAVTKDKKNWYLVGDAAMGVPYFRALNSGLIIGSQLAFIVTRKRLSGAFKAAAYNLCRPLDIMWEFTAARGKNLVLNIYDKFRRASARVPWETYKWAEKDIRDFQTVGNKAFTPKDKFGL